jgi:spore maturation protein CgeB
MPELRIAYFAHTLRSDWNNGNAHFLRGLLRALRALGHDVTAFEPEAEWSVDNLRQEERGTQSLDQFMEIYSDLDVQTYGLGELGALDLWRQRLRGVQVVILHEWNPPALAALLLQLRAELHYKLLFHDTHHRASSSPESFAELRLEEFDGIIAFGEALRRIYVDRFHLRRVWTLHEGADTTVFRPIAGQAKEQDVVWIGNWGEGERAEEIREYLVRPAARLNAKVKVFGVRYPQDGLDALRGAGIGYGGYLPNLDATAVYARSGLTLHLPRQQYSAVMKGIPTIRVFEALACGIPLLSAPWEDAEALFRPGDFCFVDSGAAMQRELQRLLHDPSAMQAQAARGLETVLGRHTCGHRAQELTDILEELL